MMTSEQKVKAVHPRARAEKQQTGYGSYYLIWTSFASGIRSAEGKTKAEDWKRAAERLERQDGQR